MWDWNCEVAMCVCRVHIKIDSDFKCTFTILVPIWLQGMALTAVQGIMGKNVNDDWGERGFLWVAPEWTIMTTRDTLTWGTWGWSAHGDGAILTLMMGQLRMTRHVTRSHRDTSQRYRGERTDPGTMERPEVKQGISNKCIHNSQSLHQPKFEKNKDCQKDLSCNLPLEDKCSYL